MTASDQAGVSGSRPTLLGCRQRDVNRASTRYRSAVVRIRLVGGVTVEVDGRALPAPASRRAWALLGWLALHPGRHSRAGVAAKLWPDVVDSSARQSIR